MEPLDQLTFTRAVQQMDAARQRGTSPRLLDRAYSAGGMLADKDIAAGRVRSATEVIEKVLSIGAPEIEALAAALAGYYERLGSSDDASGLSAAVLPLPGLRLAMVTPAHFAATHPLPRQRQRRPRLPCPEAVPPSEQRPATHHLPAPRLSSPPAAGTSDRERELVAGF